jgi:hypothetical protein
MARCYRRTVRESIPSEDDRRRPEFRGVKNGIHNGDEESVENERLNE